MSFPSVLRALLNRVSLFAALALSLSQTALSGASNLPSAADGFDPNVNGNVFALATQSDGRILVGGNFSTLTPNGGAVVTRNNLARLTPDGLLDAAFNPNVNGQVNAVVLQKDGKILIGGAFTTVGGTTRNRVARLNTDGSLDATFDPNASAQVNALAVQADGKILVGGSFTTLKSSLARNRIARLNADGTVDLSFDPNANNIVFTLAVQADGKILLGGAFTTLQPNGATATVARARAARLNSDGTVEASFDPEADNTVTAIALELDGRILVGGNYITLQPNFGAVVTANHLARFNTDGTQDPNFAPNPNGNITSVTVQSDGRILIGGYFTSVTPLGNSTAIPVSYFARLGINGSADQTFDAGANFIVTTSVVQADGKIIAGGYFTQLLSHATVAIATVRNHLARVNGDGTLDITFDPNAHGGVQTALVQADGKILIGGSFTSIGGTTRNYMARVNADGTLDAGFNPNANNRVSAIALQSDGKIIIGGNFTTIAGTTRNYIARLNADGTLDAGSFDPNANGPVNTVLVQTDGKVVLGGSFAQLTPNGATTGTARSSIARVNSDGSLDTAFDPEADAQVLALQLQSDGKIIIAGGFNSFRPGNGTVPVLRGYIARLNTDGSLDSTYSPNANAAINTVALQGDGKLVVGGAFTTLQPNGTTTVTVRGKIARLNSDGTVDTAFDPEVTTTGGQVTSLAVQGDGKILVAGAYTYIAGYARNDFSRLNADGTLDVFYDPHPNNPVQIVRLQADGQALLGGSFVTLQPFGDPVATSRLHFARVTAAGAVDSTFNSATGGQTGGQITSIAVQSDGRILTAGSLSSVGGTTSSNLFRFTNDSTPDTGYNPSTDGPINAIAQRPVTVSIPSQLNGFASLTSSGFVNPSFATSTTVTFAGATTAIARQSDGKILVGTAGNNLLRFNPDGSVDSTFAPTFDGAISGLTLQPNGQIVVYGSFATVNSTTRNRIARLNSDSSLDTTFDPNANAAVFSVLLQADGKMVVGGAFTTLQPNATTTAIVRNYIARINSDGTLDSNYNPTANSQINAMALLSDGRIVIGGAFTTVQPNGASAATTRDRVALLNTDGSVDGTFDPNANSGVSTLVAQADGKIVIGGSFTTLTPNGASTPTTRNRIARVNSDGTLDASFDPNADSQVNAIIVQPDNRLLVAGTFGNITGVARHGIARLNADGTLDTAFNPNANAQVDFVLLQPDGTILIGGSFTGLRPNGVLYVGGAFGNLGGTAISNLALLNDDGTPSTGFRPNPNGAVYALTPLPSGTVVVAGSFTNLAGAARNRLARFNADGTLDTAFNPNADNQVNALALQADGRILCGGLFTNLGGAARNRVARLNADGTLDAAFNPNADGLVNVIAVQADGKILIGGAFANVGGAARSRLARLNADGSVDSAFNPNPDGLVNAIAVQADGRIVIGGAFANVAGAARSRIARLNADGSIDTTFDPGADNTVNALALESDGKLLVGGSFAQISGLARLRFARLATTTVAAQFITVNSALTTLTWTRGGSAPELSAVSFEQSTDSIVWTSAGQATRVGTSANWQLSGLNLPKNTFLYARARGVAPTSQYGSTGVVESIRLLTPAVTFSTSGDSTTVLGSSTGATGASAVGAIFSAAGLPAGLSIDSASGIISGTPTQTGSFTVTITATNSGGTSTTTFTLSVAAGNPVGSRLAALSARTLVGGGSPLITGFVISGTESKSVLLRAVGPGLTSLGVPGALSDPELRLYNSSGQLLLTADSWAGQGSLASVFSMVGAFSLAADSADAACVVTLPPGVYTVQVADPANAGGVALAEIYEIGAATAGTTRLIEMSARGASGSGDNILIGGLVVSGTAPKKVLIRGVGPTLAALNVTGVLVDPILSVYNNQSQLIAQNDNWETAVTVNSAYPGATASTISGAAASAGAFALASGSKDSAVILTLAPGNYTVQIAGVGTTTGAALVEVYELP